MSPEDEDLRIEALRQELMREVDAVKNDVKNLKWVLGVLIGVFSLIAAILAFAADLI